MGWEEVDEGWGHAAVTWAYTNEPGFRPEYLAVQAALGVGEATSYLDVACGSGYAVQLAGEAGAIVHGIDASQRLVRIATARSPRADVRCGDMHALPWPDAHFDAVTSYRGIWGNTPDALIEAARVLKPGGHLGVSFWPADLMEGPTARLWLGLVPASRHERQQMAGMGSIAVDDRAEAMCREAGLVPGRRHRIEWEQEMASVEAGVAALLSAGPSYLAVRERGREDVESVVREALSAFEVDGLGVRLPTVVEYLIATKPA